MEYKVVLNESIDNVIAYIGGNRALAITVFDIIKRIMSLEADTYFDEVSMYERETGGTWKMAK